MLSESGEASEKVIQKSGKVLRKQLQCCWPLLSGKFFLPKKLSTGGEI